MTGFLSAPVLILTADAVRDLEGGDALADLWILFTKCKESVKDGHRLENIMWRLWHRELGVAQSYRPLTPKTNSPTPLEAGQDSPFYAPEHQALPDPTSREQSTQQFALVPSYLLPAPPMVSPDRASFTASTDSSNLSISIGRLKPALSAGKFIVAMLPNGLIESMRSPSPASGGTDPLLSPRLGPWWVCMPSTPPLFSSAPHVVVVTPTPHPTPPATPIQNHARPYQLPPLESTHLLPSLRSPNRITTPRSDARLSPPQPNRVPENAQLQASKRGVFLQESTESMSPTDSTGSNAAASPSAASAVLKEAEASGGGSSTPHKGSAESNRPVTMKLKRKEMVRHTARLALRRGQSRGRVAAARRQPSNDGREAQRPTFNSGSTSSHGKAPVNGTLQPITPARTPSSSPPPPVAVAHQPAPKKQMPSPAKPATTQKANDQRVVVADSASDSEFETDSDCGLWSSDEVSAIEEATKEREEILLKEAALEAQRQRDMFAKVPKHSYSNLDRSTRSGLLSVLLNPDPNVFPPNHPYRSSRLTQGMTQPPRRGNTLSGLSVMAPLSTIASKSAAAIPTETMGEVKIEGKIQVSKIIAHERLSALAGRGARNSYKAQPNPPPACPPTATTVVAAGPPSRPALQSTTSAPIQGRYPYNLPLPSAPSTPRTTRRHMLSTELSGSMREQMLWERHVSRQQPMGPNQRRQSATVLSGSGLRPMTTLVSGRSLRSGSNGGHTTAGRGAEETERVESKWREITRNPSCADDYHCSGW